MKKKKTETTALFFDSPKIKKIMADPKQRADINAKFRYLHILEDIERLRKSEGISQTALSKITKISQEEISRIERGKRNVTFETYFNLLNSLGYEAEIRYFKIHDTNKPKSTFTLAHRYKSAMAAEAQR